MGATIKTVATFSTNAEINPARIQINNIAQVVFFALSTIISAIYAGNLLSIKISAIINVPTNMPITFQLIEKKASLKEITRLKISRIAADTAIWVLLLGKNMKSKYAMIKTDKETILEFIILVYD
jgi:hypothetical protein